MTSARRGRRSVRRQCVPRPGLVGLVLAMGLLLGACVGENPRSGVNVKSLATDLVYGIPPTPVPAPPADTNPVADEPAGIIVQDTTEPRRFEPEPIEQIDSRNPCPEVPPDKFPVPATSVPENRPQEGEYEWRVNGTQDLGGIIGEINLPPRTIRQIVDVKGTEDGWEYTLVQREMNVSSNDIVKTTYEVQPEEGGGLFLTRVVRERENGTVKSRFEPSPAVQLLPFPVEPGTAVDSVGVDPVNFSALRVQGTVPERKRINACGDPVDSWLVDAVQEFVDPSGEETRRNYDYGIATQMGALLVFEHVETPCAAPRDPQDSSTCANEPDLAFDTHLGQVEPDPLDE